MTRCAVVLGVDRTGDLPPLNAAASGAVDFGNWCKGQQIETVVLTDRNDAKVRIQDIRTAIRTFAEKRTYSQLILFFAGHGILKAPDDEYWLLSDAPGDEYEAVNVVQSVANARNNPFRHVVFISDACRSMPGTYRLTAVKGMGVFPNSGLTQARPKIDQFYATAPSDPAYEAKLEDALSFGGIFTRDLLLGLKGEDPSVPESIGGRWIVTTNGLDPYLTRQVPISAAKVNITLNQSPEIRAESRPPLYLAELTGWLPPSAGVTPAAAAVDPQLITRLDQLPVQPKVSYAPLSIRATRQLTAFWDAAQRVYFTRGREGFESGSGFSVIGAKVTTALAAHAYCDVFEEAGAHQVRVRALDRNDHRLTRATSVLLEFDSGRGTVCAAWPEFVGTVLVEDGTIVNVNYTPARHGVEQTPEYVEYQSRVDEIESRRAKIAAAARTGRFRLDPEHALENARYLRFLKKFDPTLGLYAAYAYAQVGAVKEIRSLQRHMRKDLDSVPFDVMLLARLQRQKRDYVPFCPMLTQGWAYLDSKAAMKPPVRAAWSHLVPSLWTTFDSQGVTELRSMFEE
jgi:Caspase domain